MHSKQGCVNQWKICYSDAFLIWIDDLLVHSKSFQEHLQNLGKVFERLPKFNMKLNPKKSELFRCTTSGKGGRYSRMEYRLILPTSRDLQSSLIQRRQGSCSIDSALSNGLEAQFQTLPVTWHH